MHTYYIYIYILWMEEILHQLIDGKHHIIYRVDEASKLAQDFATIHSMYMLTNGQHNKRIIYLSYIYNWDIHCCLEHMCVLFLHHT